MGIRDTSYYGFSTMMEQGPTPTSQYVSGNISDVVVDNVHGRSYVVTEIYPGDPLAFVDFEQIDNNQFAGSTSIDLDSSGNLFSNVGPHIITSQGQDSYGIFSSSVGGNNCVRVVAFTSSVFNFGISLAVNKRNDHVYASYDNLTVPESYIASSSAPGRVWGSSSIAITHAQKIAFDSSNNVYISQLDTNGAVYGVNDNTTNDYLGTASIIRKSTNNGATWSGVGGTVTSAANQNKLGVLAIDSSDRIYHVGSLKGADGKWKIAIRSSSDAGVSFGSASYGNATTDYFCVSVQTDSRNNVFIGGISASSGFILASFNSGASWNPVASEIGRKTTDLYIDNLDNIYWSLKEVGKKMILKKGKLTANSASIGPRMLSPSFGYVQSEISGVITEKFNLNNISEFPHSSGLFQMKNLVLGTFSQGRVGKTDDAIIQKRFIGSFVRVLFPRQDVENEVRGYDAAKKPGKLTSDWQFGDPINIENKQFDSLALNCSILKQVSGTLDSILIRVETKPLNSTGFSVDQTTELTVSSSYFSETIYRDELHRKDVDYGDLSVSEISWKIPIELKNVKEIRIAAKQKNGQSDDKNKQLLILGRFVTTSKDHNET